MGGHGRVPDEGCLLARVEETQPHIMVRAIGGEHERHLGVRELACHGEQGGVALTVGVEDDGRRIAGEACGGKGVYLENTQGCLRSLSVEFCTHPRRRLHL